MTGATRRTLEFLGIDAPPDLPIRTRSARQSDALNHEWAARYRASPPVYKTLRTSSPGFPLGFGCPGARAVRRRGAARRPGGPAGRRRSPVSSAA